MTGEFEELNAGAVVDEGELHSEPGLGLAAPRVVGVKGEPLHRLQQQVLGSFPTTFRVHVVGEQS